MITIGTAHLYEQMKIQKIVGIRVFDNEDHLVFHYSPKEAGASTTAQDNCKEAFKQFLKGIPEKGKVIVRLKKHHNLKESEEIVYELLLEDVAEPTINKPNGQEQQTTNSWNPEQFNEQLDKRVKEAMTSARAEQENIDLKKKIEDLEKPIGRMGSYITNIAEFASAGVDNWARKNGYAGPTMQGPYDDAEEAEIIEEEEDETIKQKKYQEAVQIFDDNGSTGQFLLDVANKVKQDPNLLNMLANFLNIPKPKK